MQVRISLSLDAVIGRPTGGWFGSWVWVQQGGGHVRFRVLTHYREKIVCQNFPQFIGEYGKVVDF